VDDRIGQRVRTWRRRRGGMSQKLLADLAGLSQAYISQIESGERPLDRKSTQAAIAAALNISVAQLLGRPGERSDPVRAQALAHVPAIRAALVEIAAGERRTPARDLHTLRGQVAVLTDRRNAADYAALAPQLPGLLLDLHGHDGDAAALAVEALFAARYALKTMGHPDLALIAAQIGVQVAEEAGPAWRGQALYSLVQAFPVESADLGARMLARAADEIQPVSDRAAQEIYGCLHILAAFTSAVAVHAEAAAAHLTEAADVAASLGEPARSSDLSAGINGNWFGPTQVDYWRVAVAAELGDAGEAQRVAARIDLATVPVPNRWVYHWSDLGRALAAGGKDREAMHALAKAERAAPQHFRFNPVVRDLVATLIERARRRSVSQEMADLARTLGIDVV
jgi:transcriptional regulator with XRE-family HTH domain